MAKKNSLKEAVRFHGHLGPYLVLGLLAGEVALKKLGERKYFGINVKVWGANYRPKSCLIDGLQLSTGATYGKGNIRKFKADAIKLEFFSEAKNKKVILGIKSKIIQKINKAKDHKDAEKLAKELFKEDSYNIFKTIVRE